MQRVMATASSTCINCSLIEAIHLRVVILRNLMLK
uniref:Uncharacterized protein n=1 Tax=Arundo donax TaxID=35708 RepID=A0A0A9AU66_ARUDO